MYNRNKVDNEINYNHYRKIKFIFLETFYLKCLLAAVKIALHKVLLTFEMEMVLDYSSFICFD